MPQITQIDPSCQQLTQGAAYLAVVPNDSRSSGTAEAFRPGFWAKLPVGLSRVVAAGDLRSGVLLALIELRSRGAELVRVSARAIVEHLGRSCVSRVSVYLREWELQGVIWADRRGSTRHGGRLWFVGGLDGPIPEPTERGKLPENVSRKARKMTTGSRVDRSTGDLCDRSTGDRSSSAGPKVDRSTGDLCDRSTGDRSTYLEEESKTKPEPGGSSSRDSSDGSKMLQRVKLAWRVPAVAEHLTGADGSGVPYSEIQIERAAQAVCGAARRTTIGADWTRLDSLAYLERMAGDRGLFDGATNPLYAAISERAVELRGRAVEFVRQGDGSIPAPPAPDTSRSRADLDAQEAQHEARKRRTPRISQIFRKVPAEPAPAEPAPAEPATSRGSMPELLKQFLEMGAPGGIGAFREWSSSI